MVYYLATCDEEMSLWCEYGIDVVPLYSIALRGDFMRLHTVIFLSLLVTFTTYVKIQGASDRLASLHHDLDAYIKYGVRVRIQHPTHL